MAHPAQTDPDALAAIAPAPTPAPEPAPVPAPESLCLSCAFPGVYFTELVYAGAFSVCATYIWFIFSLAVCRPTVQQMFS